MRLSPFVLSLAGLATLASAAAPMTRARAVASARAQFAAADRNHDGRLDRGEVTQRIVRVYGQRGMSTGRSRIMTNFWFNRLDGNHDSFISLQEAVGMANDTFGRFDTNRNGRIDPREQAAARAFLRNPAR